MIPTGYILTKNMYPRMVHVIIPCSRLSSKVIRRRAKESLQTVQVAGLERKEP